jgi:hypothetical protein
MKKTLLALLLLSPFVCFALEPNLSYIGRYTSVNKKGERVVYDIRENPKKVNSYLFYRNGITDPCFTVVMLDTINFKIKRFFEVSDGRFFYEYKGGGRFGLNEVYTDLSISKTSYLHGKQHTFYLEEKLLLKGVKRR